MTRACPEEIRARLVAARLPSFDAAVWLASLLANESGGALEADLLDARVANMKSWDEDLCDLYVFPDSSWVLMNDLAQVAVVAPDGERSCVVEDWGNNMARSGSM